MTAVPQFQLCVTLLQPLIRARSGRVEAVWLVDSSRRARDLQSEGLVTAEGFADAIGCDLDQLKRVARDELLRQAFEDRHRVAAASAFYILASGEVLPTLDSVDERTVWGLDATSCQTGMSPDLLLAAWVNLFGWSLQPPDDASLELTS